MTLLLTNDDIAQVLRPADVIDSLDAAYRAHAAGDAVCPPRLDIQSPENDRGKAYQLGLAVGLAQGRYGCLRVKSDMVFQTMEGGRRRKQKYCVRPGTYMGLLLVFDVTSGALAAIVHDGLIQRMRVGADSALGVRYMAREDTRTLGLLGAGGMAGTHLDAITAVRPLERVRVYSPTPESRRAFATEAARRHPFPVEAVDTPEAALDGADLVAACTNAIGPVVPGALLRPGMHVTCIGGTLDAEADGRIDVTLRFGTADAPEEAPGWRVEDECLTFAMGGAKSGHGGTRRFHSISPERRVMFADLLADPSRGRTAPDQITFSERGNIHGVQFAAVAGALYERARDAGLGHPLEDALFLQSIRN